MLFMLYLNVNILGSWYLFLSMVRYDNDNEFEKKESDSWTWDRI